MLNPPFGEDGDGEQEDEGHESATEGASASGGPTQPSCDFPQPADGDEEGQADDRREVVGKGPGDRQVGEYSRGADDQSESAPRVAPHQRNEGKRYDQRSK